MPKQILWECLSANQWVGMKRLIPTQVNFRSWLQGNGKKGATVLYRLFIIAYLYTNFLFVQYSGRKTLQISFNFGLGAISCFLWRIDLYVNGLVCDGN